MPEGDRSRWRHARAPGLDPWREQDACGVGFVARASGERSHAVTRLALEALKRVAHRGAAATDSSGDGAGLLTQIPGPLFYREARQRGLPLEPGEPFAVGMFFLPREAAALARGREQGAQLRRHASHQTQGRLDQPGTEARAPNPQALQLRQRRCRGARDHVQGPRDLASEPRDGLAVAHVRHKQAVGSSGQVAVGSPHRRGEALRRRPMSRLPMRIRSPLP